MSGTAAHCWLKELRASTIWCSSLTVPQVMLGVTLGALLDLHCTRCVLPLQPPGLRPMPTSHLRTPPVTSISCRTITLLSLLHKLTLSCVTSVWHYCLIGEVSPKKPGIVARHKCVWVTAFRDAPLFMTARTPAQEFQLDSVLLPFPPSVWIEILDSNLYHAEQRSQSNNWNSLWHRKN